MGHIAGLRESPCISKSPSLLLQKQHKSSTGKPERLQQPSCSGVGYRHTQCQAFLLELTLLSQLWCVSQC
jgi:hypothetical protein